MFKGEIRKKYSKTCVKRPLSKRPKNGFQAQLLLKAGQKYCRMLQRPLFCLVLRGRFTHVLLYVLHKENKPLYRSYF